jgi:hypothetical protein
VDPATAELLGNFPQAVTQLASCYAAWWISLRKRSAGGNCLAEALSTIRGSGRGPAETLGISIRIRIRRLVLGPSLTEYSRPSANYGPPNWRHQGLADH